MFTTTTGYVRPLPGALLLALLLVPLPARAAGELDEMISPISMPTVNEDPRVTSELRPMYMYTKISDDFVTQGGNYSVVAVQARVALTDRIGFIATKDGYIFLNPDEVVDGADGFANIAFGLKGVLYKDEDAAFILSGGLRYKAPWGNTDVLQGKGKGTLNPFLSVAKGFGNFHVQGYTGSILALSVDDTHFYDVALHFDYRLFERLYPLFEFNWRYALRGGQRLPIDQEGWDLVNLGSKDAGGESVAAVAFGARYRVTDTIDIGAAADVPVTDRHDILGWRVTTDLIWRPMGWNAIF